MDVHINMRELAIEPNYTNGCERLEQRQLHTTESFTGFALVFFIISFSIVVVSLFWWLWRKDVLYLRRRNFPLIWLIAVGAMCNQYVGPLSRYIYSKAWFRERQQSNPIPSCFIASLAYFLVIPLLVGPQIIRLELFRRRIIYNRKVAEVFEMHTNKELGTADATLLKDIQRAKYLSTDRYGLLLGGVNVLLAVSMGIIFAIVLCRPFDDPSEFECLLDEVAPISIAINFFVVIVSASFFVYVYRKVRHEPDPFGILQEIRFTYIIPAPLGLLSVVLSLTDPGKVQEQLPVFWSWNILSDVAIFIYMFSTLPLQVYKSYQKSNHDDILGQDMTFKELLANKTGYLLFEKHLVNEFSAENLTLWNMVNWWKDKYDTTPSDVSKREAQNIYLRWLSENSLFQANVSWADRQDIAAHLNDPGDFVDKKLFDNVSRSVYRLMEFDSFDRFKQQDMYKQFVGIGKQSNSVAADLENTVSISQLSYHSSPGETSQYED